jgi:hypothetical protein
MVRLQKDPQTSSAEKYHQAQRMQKQPPTKNRIAYSVMAKRRHLPRDIQQPAAADRPSAEL